MPEARHLARVVAGRPATDGAGVRLTRMIGTPECDMIDPFLMLDRFDSDDPAAYIAGFPDHPHRGFETVTIMLDGRMRHRDTVGNEGLLGPGDVQWMTAGRGIIHSEMPEMIEGRMRGFQLWLNLPARLKMTDPAYADIAAASIPAVDTGGGTVRVIASVFEGVGGPGRPRTPVRVLDARLKPGGEFIIEPETGSNVFACVYEGSLEATDPSGRARQAAAPALAVFDGEGPIQARAGNEGAALLYCEGAPIGEPVARHGPFVMNTRAEIEQAFEDFHAGSLGAP